MTGKKIPWSGWGWPSGSYPPPMAKKNGPLDKFDQYFKKETNKELNTVQWELSHHYNPGCGWCGHCHGWAAAAILEREPTTPAVRAGITFSVGDLKGLLTEVHCTDSLDLWKGWRDVIPPYKEDELNALEFHWVMRNWVGNGEPVVMDIEKKPAVWNHPAYKCKMTPYPDRFGLRRTHIKCDVWFASGNVSLDYVGTKTLVKSYRYWIEGDIEDPSDGDWEQFDRPGFIWHPDYVDTTAPGANPVIKCYDSHIKELAKCQLVMVFAVSDLAATAPIGPVIPDMSPDGPVYPLLFRGLVSLHGTEGYPIPAVAHSWDVSENGLVYAFHLHEGVTFHDGTLLTAKDVAFTYNAVMNAVDSPHSRALKEIIADIDVADENTIVFKLKQAMDDFPAVHGWYWILPQHVVEEVGLEAFSAHPVGSGPFAFESRASDRLTLAVYADYFFGSPQLDRIVFVDVPGVDQRFDLLSEGRADVALFDHTVEVEKRAQKVPYVVTFAVPAPSPRRLEVQSVRLLGRIPSEFDGAWNILQWDIDLEALGPTPAAPTGSLMRRPPTGEEERMSTDTAAADSSQWREGVWWRIQVQQRAIASGIADPGWTLPFHLVFEIVGKEVVEDTLCYHIQVTYPDRPRNAEYKYADIWVSEDEHIPVKGILHIGHKRIPMRYDFLMRLLKTTTEVDTEEMTSTFLDLQKPEEKIKLEAFETRTSTGGKCLLSPSAPFPLQIEEPTYKVVLQDWGG